MSALLEGKITRGPKPLFSKGISNDAVFVIQSVFNLIFELLSYLAWRGYRSVKDVNDTSDGEIARNLKVKPL